MKVLDPQKNTHLAQEVEELLLAVDILRGKLDMVVVMQSLHAMVIKVGWDYLEEKKLDR